MNKFQKKEFTIASKKSTISLCEKALGCQTGLCGVTFDPILVGILNSLENLRNNGYNVKRFNMNNHKPFIENEIVKELLSKGLSILQSQ